MLEQLFVSDELSYLKKERELFREYEGRCSPIIEQFSHYSFPIK